MSTYNLYVDAKKRYLDIKSKYDYQNSVIKKYAEICVDNLEMIDDIEIKLKKTMLSKSGLTFVYEIKISDYVFTKNHTVRPKRGKGAEIPMPEDGYVYYQDNQGKRNYNEYNTMKVEDFIKFMKHRLVYDGIFKNTKLPFFSETSGFADPHKMKQDFRYLWEHFENVEERKIFISLRKKLNNIMGFLSSESTNCMFLTPNDIEEFDNSNFTQYQNSSFKLNSKSTLNMIEEISKPRKEGEYIIDSNYNEFEYCADELS